MAGGPDPTALGRRAVVFVIDDNVGFLRAIRAVLEGSRPAFEVHTVETGEEAFVFLRAQSPTSRTPRPDFVVLDFRLPDATAPELLRRLRADEWPEVPVLVLSQAYWPEDEAAALDAGATRFLAKPSDPDALHDVVARFWHDAGGG